MIWRQVFITFLVGAILGGCVFWREPTLADQQQAQDLVDSGVLALRGGDFERAEAHFRVAYELAPLASALDGLGCVCFLRGDILEAEKLFLRALDEDPDYSAAYGNLGLLYESVGLNKKAEEAYSEALAENPGDFRTRNNYAGFMLAAKGLSEETRDRVKKQLLRAEALAQHPLIKQNIQKME